MSTAVRTVAGVKVIEAEPGAPLPPDVPSWAERCDLVEKPDLAPVLRPWVIGLGVLGILGSAVTLAFFSHWGMAPLPLSVVVLWYGLRPGTTAILTPSPTGRYVAFEEATDPDAGAMAVWGRIAALGLGLVLVLVAGGQLFAEEPDWMAVGSLGPFGLYLLYYGITGTDPRGDAPGPSASLRFRALADPARPLGPDDAERRAVHEPEAEKP
jgi:hypothetical protein